MSESAHGTKRRSLLALDALNFFLADVRDGIGPYLAIFLLASYKWDATSIGIAMSSMGVATLIAQTPAGAAIDKTKHKKLIMAISAAVIALACVLMTVFVTLPMIIFAQALCGVAAAFLAPGLAAVTLGIVGRKELSKRTGRNEAFNHAGNVTAAILAGLVGHYIAREWIFYLVAAMALLSMVSILMIDAKDIDHRVARGCDAEGGAETAAPGADNLSFAVLLKDKRVLAFAGAMMLFHFANAAMLPLVGQLLSTGKETGASLYMSACIVVAQLVMIPMAVFAGKYAEVWGRKPILLIALVILPIRGFLYTVCGTNPIALVSVQSLDGIGAGIFGVVSVLVIADLTKGTGRYNLASGALATAVGLGASLSTAITGVIVSHSGYNAAFLTLTAIACVAAALFYLFVPESQNDKGQARQRLTPVHEI